MSEALCQCGHAGGQHVAREWDCYVCGSDTCTAFTPPPTREPIRLTDEAEARREAQIEVLLEWAEKNDENALSAEAHQGEWPDDPEWDIKCRAWADGHRTQATALRLHADRLRAARLAGGPTLADAWDKAMKTAGDCGCEHDTACSFQTATNPYRTPESEDTE